MNGKTGWARVACAFRCSLQGFRRCFKTEEAFRQEAALCAVLVPASFFIAGNVVEWLVLNGSLAMVLVVELLNTAVERTVDRISCERHELSRDAKDMGSAAVMLSLIAFCVCWGAILLF